MNMNPAEEFADRCYASLVGMLHGNIVIWEMQRGDILKVLAGSWEAFEAVRAQHPTPPLNVVPPRASGLPKNVEEVAAFLAKIEYPIDAGAFWDFYQTKDWRVGRGNVKMKCWESACRNWKRYGWGKVISETGSPAPAKFKPQASLGALQIELEKILDQISAIVRPGGAAHARSASSVSPEEMLRYKELCERRDGLRKRVAEFSQ